MPSSVEGATQMLHYNLHLRGDMLDTFLSYYKQLFKPLAKEHGFRVYGQSFYRLRNDLIQFFVLRRASHGGACTIEWSVLPLCIGVEKSHLLAAAKDIGPFLGTREWWYYDPRDDDSKLSALKSMLAATEKYLMPALDKVVDSASAYELQCDYDRRTYGEVLMHDRGKVCFAIKMGDYARAITHLKAIEAKNLIALGNALDNKIGVLGEEHRQAYIDRCNTTLRRIRYEIERLSIPDMDYINNFITRNEELSLMNLGIKR